MQRSTLAVFTLLLATGCIPGSTGDLPGKDAGVDAGTSDAGAQTISVEIVNGNLSVPPGATVQLAATVSTSKAASAYTLMWASADVNVASVNSSGLLTGASTGSTTVTATATLTETGATASAMLMVTVTPSLDAGVDAGTRTDAGMLSGYMGFATLDGGVTGGAGGPTVVVTTYAELTAAVSDSAARIIHVSGSIDGSNRQINVGSNKSIIGLPGAELHGLGLYMFGTFNIIIQNLKMYGGDPSTFDSVGFSTWSVKDGAHNVWVDHCELFPSPADSANLGHSLASVSNGADFVTVSWTALHGQYLGLLIGSSSTLASDADHLRVTVHHCLFEDILERQPKLLWGHAHVFNNYYKNAKTNGHTPVGITAICGGTIRTDNNFFQNFNGAAITTQYSTEPTGFISGLSTNVKDSAGSFNAIESTWLPPYAYDAWLTPATDVPAVVTAGVGANLP